MEAIFSPDDINEVGDISIAVLNHSDQFAVLFYLYHLENL